jgi:hypothetical protein
MSGVTERSKLKTAVNERRIACQMSSTIRSRRLSGNTNPQSRGNLPDLRYCRIETELYKLANLNTQHLSGRSDNEPPCRDYLRSLLL